MLEDVDVSREDDNGDTLLDRLMHLRREKSSWARWQLAAVLYECLPRYHFAEKNVLKQMYLAHQREAFEHVIFMRGRARLVISCDSQTGAISRLKLSVLDIENINTVVLDSIIRLEF